MIVRPCLILLGIVVVSWALDCSKPVGIENGTILDSAITSNSEHNKWHKASEGRLNNYKGKPSSNGVGCWCADRSDGIVNRYIQFDLGSVRKIGKITTQGRNASWPQYVTKYRVSYSKAGTIFTGIFDIQENEVIYSGNADQNTPVSNDLPSPGRYLEARYIRVLPHEFQGNICMRFEFYECVEAVTQPPTAPTTQPPVVCPAGYRLGSDGKTCEDINECHELTSKCNQYCHNTNGSYFCHCQLGYKLASDNHTCLDIDECLENNGGCSQLCIDSDGSFQCGCNSGYRLKSDEKNCEDVDECTENTSGCNHNCTNTVGSFICSCKPGYKLGSDKKTCQDIDECQEDTDGCSQICLNNDGSFTCDCNSGYRLKSDKKTCEDIDECLDNNGGCSHGCQNLEAKYICTCPSGYQLDGTEKNCEDKNECDLANGGCEHTCNNTVGNFSCSCNTGSKLNPDGLTCSDIDECADGTSLCDSETTNCINLSPLYECKCKEGSLPITGDIYKCKAKTCSALIESTGTTVSPSSCLQSEGSVVGDLCKFSCREGFELPGNEDTLLCLSSGTWNASIISCKRVSCPALAAPTNGRITPSSCTSTGNDFEGKCYYACDSGFEIAGVLVKTCLSSGQWDSQEEPTCAKSQPAPYITCPDNVDVVLSPGANTADVSALLQDPTSNQPPSRITITPGQYLVDKIFPAGTTTLTYVARNENGKTAQCQMDVSVEDKEAPKTSDCPLAIYETTTTTSKAVTWTPPTFTDNVGVKSVTTTGRKPGDTFDIGSTNVHYTALDDRNNKATCSFTVHLKRLQCQEPEAPSNSLNFICYVSLRFCSYSCQANKKLFKNMYGYVSCDANTLQWDEFPDCVDFVDPLGDGSCPSQYVKQGGLSGAQGGNFCVKCPMGLYYDTSSKTCKPCQIGFISKQEGSLQCEACPANSSTLVEGSKTCTAQCFRGKFSNSGFDLPADLEPCEPCPINTYQNQTGQKGCEQCPGGTSTQGSGSTSVSDCGGPPVISSFGPNPTNATETKQTQFECYGHGLPLPSFSIKKVKPAPDGFGGPVTQESIIGPDGNQIGIRHIITVVSEHDAGAYECKVENTFGTDQKYLYVNVELYFGVGKRRRRRRRRGFFF